MLTVILLQKQICDRASDCQVQLEVNQSNDYDKV